MSGSKQIKPCEECIVQSTCDQQEDCLELRDWIWETIIEGLDAQENWIDNGLDRFKKINIRGE